VVTAEVQGEDIPEVPTMTAEDLYEGVPTEMVVDKMVVEEEVDEATTLTTITYITTTAHHREHILLHPLGTSHPSSPAPPP
jgi:hypothetical protein